MNKKFLMATLLVVFVVIVVFLFFRAEEPVKEGKPKEEGHLIANCSIGT